MKLTNSLRHAEFGKLGVFVRGLVYYSLSPFELKAFDKPLKRVPIILRRCMEGAVQVGPCKLYYYKLYFIPFILNSESAIVIILDAVFGWFLHDYVEKKYDQMNRKDPNDYVNDQ